MNRSACVCGHPHEAHEHYRAGTDCSLCGPAACRRFRAAGGLRARIGRVLHPGVAGLPVEPVEPVGTESAEPVVPPAELQGRRARSRDRAYKSGPAA